MRWLCSADAQSTTLYTFLVTLAWKISIHTATLAGAVTILVIVFGPYLLPVVILPVLVGWAGVELGITRWFRSSRARSSASLLPRLFFSWPAEWGPRLL
jgi:hypothetical protein